MQHKKPNWVIAAIIISILGSALHFAFELSGNLSLVGTIAAVNESVWEHMKLAYWPMLLVLALLSRRYGYKACEISFPLAVAITSTLLSIPLMYYLVTCGLGIHSVILDIILFIIAIVLGVYVFTRLLNRDKKNLCLLGWIIILLWGIAFIVFTFAPPHLPIFYDNSQQLYGIL